MQSFRRGTRLLSQAFEQLAQGSSLAISTTTESGAQAAVKRAAGGALNASGKPVLTKEFDVYRWDPDNEGKPAYKRYTVDINK